MSLAYLPSEMIPAAYQDLKIQIMEDFPGLFDTFFKYFDKEWIPKAALWSCYRRRHNSNNYLESLHRNYKKLIGVRPHVGYFFSK